MPWALGDINASSPLMGYLLDGFIKFTPCAPRAVVDSALDTRAKEERRFDIACRKLSHFLTEINENKTTQRKRVKDDENMT